MYKLLVLLFILLHVTTIKGSDYLSAFSGFFKTDSIKQTTETDTNKIKIVVDTLKPLSISSFNLYSEFSSTKKRKEIELLDYRYSGDLINYLPFGFLQDLGSLGKPNEATIYGYGFNNVSYLINGNSINNRTQNSFNLYNLQLESIDSVEVYSLPRGFLGGSFLNPVTINFITKNNYPAKPYTKIRFSQASNEEGIIDFLFHTYINKKTDVKVNISNYSSSDGFDNTEYGNWQAFVSAKYIMSNIVNFMFDYNYSRAQTRLNGGVDLERLESTYYSEFVKTNMFDQLAAFVNYEDRYQKEIGHKVNFKVLATVLKSLPTTLDFYYQNNAQSFHDLVYDYNNYHKIDTTIQLNKYNLVGININQKFNFPYFESDFGFNMERISFNSEILSNNRKINSVSFWGINRLTIIPNIVPSVYYKLSNYNNHSYNGFGGDVNINYAGLNFYVGASAFQKPLNPIESNNYSQLPDIQTVNNIEVGIKYKSENYNVSLGYFLSNNNKTPYYVVDKTVDSIKTENFISYFTKETKTQGINLNFSLKYWKLLITNNSSLFYTKTDIKTKFVPEYTAYSGIYYIDTLFNRNLKLKAGLNFRIVGKQDGREYNYNNNMASFYYESPTGEVEAFKSVFAKSSFQMDIFVAARIQDAAMLYFVFENLLNEENYYITYYPKQSRGIRFGFNWELFN